MGSHAHWLHRHENFVKFLKAAPVRYLHCTKCLNTFSMSNHMQSNTFDDSVFFLLLIHVLHVTFSLLCNIAFRWPVCCSAFDPIDCHRSIWSEHRLQFGYFICCVSKNCDTISSIFFFSYVHVGVSNDQQTVAIAAGNSMNDRNSFSLYFK